jgi:hypothetical protein
MLGVLPSISSKLERMVYDYDRCLNDISRALPVLIELKNKSLAMVEQRFGSSNGLAYVLSEEAYRSMYNYFRAGTEKSDYFWSEFEKLKLDAGFQSQVEGGCYLRERYTLKHMLCEQIIEACEHLHNVPPDEMKGELKQLLLEKLLELIRSS